MAPTLRVLGTALLVGPLAGSIGACGALRRMSGTDAVNKNDKAGTAGRASAAPGAMKDKLGARPEIRFL